MKFEIYSCNHELGNRRKIKEFDDLSSAKFFLENLIENCNLKNNYIEQKIINNNHILYAMTNDTDSFEIIGVEKHLEVVAGIIKNDNKILCMQRDDGKYKYVAYKWEFPGGKIEPGETNECALKRELMEEMEMDIEIVDHFCDVEYIYPDFSIKMYCYNVYAKSPNFVMNVHHDYKWLTIEELDSLDWAPADRPVVEKIMEKEF